MNFDIILVTWNRPEYTKRTIASLIESGAFRDCDRFIVVDNHSTDEDMTDLLSDLTHYQRTFIIRRPQNDGWGMAVNDGLGLSRASHVFITNNDVEYRLGFHQRLLGALDSHPTVGLIGVWRHTAHGFTKGGVMDEQFRDMDNVPAVGWMLPKYAMEKVGMLTENGPCETRGGNGEDTDYVMRMKQAGFLTGVYGEDLATHLDGY